MHYRLELFFCFSSLFLLRLFCVFVSGLLSIPNKRFINPKNPQIIPSKIISTKALSITSTMNSRTIIFLIST